MTPKTSRHAAASPADSHASARQNTATDSRHSAGPPAWPALGHEPGFLNLLAELGRQQLAVATESSSALCRGSEALRKVQQDAAHEASVRHAEAAHKLAAPCPLAELLSIQTELLRANVQSATRYWQQLARVALQTQREMMLSTTQLLENSPGGGLKPVLQAFQAAVPPMATSFFVPSRGELGEQPH